MATPPSSSHTSNPHNINNNNNDILKEIKRHEVAIGELNTLHSSKSVYLKNGNIFFRTSIQKAISSEQRKLDLMKNKLQKTSGEQ